MSEPVEVVDPEPEPVEVADPEPVEVADPDPVEVVDTEKVGRRTQVRRGYRLGAGLLDYVEAELEDRASLPSSGVARSVEEQQAHAIEGAVQILSVDPLTPPPTATPLTPPPSSTTQGTPVTLSGDRCFHHLLLAIKGCSSWVHRARTKAERPSTAVWADRGPHRCRVYFKKFQSRPRPQELQPTEKVQSIKFPSRAALPCIVRQLRLTGLWL